MPSDTISQLSQKVAQGLKVCHLEIIDESHLHAGHAGARPGGNSHFRALIVSSDFEKIPRVKRHQIIYRILEDDLKAYIHALALTTLTPEEYQKYSPSS